MLIYKRATHFLFEHVFLLETHCLSMCTLITKCLLKVVVIRLSVPQIALLTDHFKPA